MGLNSPKARKTPQESLNMPGFRDKGWKLRLLVGKVHYLGENIPKLVIGHGKIFHYLRTVTKAVRRNAWEVRDKVGGQRRSPSGLLVFLRATSYMY